MPRCSGSSSCFHHIPDIHHSSCSPDSFLLCTFDRLNSPCSNRLLRCTSYTLHSHSLCSPPFRNTGIPLPPSNSRYSRCNTDSSRCEWNSFNLCNTDTTHQPIHTVVIHYNTRMIRQLYNNCLRFCRANNCHWSSRFAKDHRTHSSRNHPSSSSWSCYRSSNLPMSCCGNTLLVNRTNPHKQSTNWSHR